MLAGCQQVEFQRSQPTTIGVSRDRTLLVTRRLAPNVMLLLDTSGSMLQPVDPAVCPAGCGTAGTPCPSSCPTRLSEVRSALDAYLAANAERLRVGLTTYPADFVCGAPSAARVPVPAPEVDDQALEARRFAAEEARRVISAVVPAGGTPTAAALRFVAEQPALNDATDGRDDFVVLITDGLPNCNDAHPASLCGGAPTPEQTAACACTVASCEGPATCSRGCLDADGAVSAVEGLRAKGVRTAVVGFGAEAAGAEAARVLTKLAQAGGLEPWCGGVPCERAYYLAGDAAGLTSALTTVTDDLWMVCTFALQERLERPEFLEVRVNDVVLAPGPETWRYDGVMNAVEFTGAACDALKLGTVSDPVRVELRLAHVL